MKVWRRRVEVVSTGEVVGELVKPDIRATPKYLPYLGVLGGEVIDHRS